MGLKLQLVQLVCRETSFFSHASIPNQVSFSPLLDWPLLTARQSLESPGAPKKKKKILSSPNSPELPNLHSWRYWGPGIFNSKSFPADSDYPAGENIAVLGSFLYLNRPGNATALETVYPATLMPLVTKSAGAVLAGTSNNRQRTPLSQKTVRCTIPLYEVSRVDNSTPPLHTVVEPKNLTTGTWQRCLPDPAPCPLPPPPARVKIGRASCRERV